MIIHDLKKQLVSDKTLEYICFIVENGFVKEIRKYHEPERYIRTVNTQYAAPFFDLINQILNDYKLKMCDVSSSIFDGRPTKRMTFLLPKRMSYSHCINIIEAFGKAVGNPNIPKSIECDLAKSKKYICSDFAPLLQFGIELYHDQALCSIKYYIGLKDFNAINGDKKTLIKEYCSSLIGYLIPEYCSDFIDYTENIGFQPALLGVNIYETKIEYKLYYKSCQFRYDPVAIKKEIASVFSFFKINDNQFSDANIQEIIDEKYYLKGVACSFQDPIWRMYFHSIV